MESVILEATEPFVLRGYGQLNRGERAVFTTEQALALLAEFPEGFKEVQDAVLKAPSAPTVDKMQRTERKK